MRFQSRLTIAALLVCLWQPASLLAGNNNTNYSVQGSRKSTLSTELLLEKGKRQLLWGSGLLAFSALQLSTGAILVTRPASSEDCVAPGVCDDVIRFGDEPKWAAGWILLAGGSSAFLSSVILLMMGGKKMRLGRNDGYYLSFEAPVISGTASLALLPTFHF